MRKSEVVPLPHTYTKLNVDQTPKYKIAKLLEDNVEINLCELG